MTEINQRIDQIAVKFYKGNNSKFAKDTGTSEANIRNYRNSIKPKIDFVIALNTILEINFEWLLLGKGKMLKNETYQLKNSDDILLQEIINTKNDLIESQKATIESQKETIEFLKRTNENIIPKVDKN